ncbi:tyrosine-type recombinase/integrase [uncultured Acetobacterium sp.]|uniref:tyrosine-type recombinase/integrase n=1 Tax=uncultured Acetobacterium sp. TaxID=217139 RepID=UPI0025EB45DD|nr:tyrosine-type recombinase/integrase [uncultured Acetobacterium sp.]
MPTRKTILLTKAIDEFIHYLKSKERSKETERGYNIVLQNFKVYLEKEMNGQVYVDEITVNHMEDYLSYRKDQGDQPITRNKSLYIFRSFFNYLVRKDHVERNISLNLEPIQYQQKERVYLLPEEMVTLIEAVDHIIVKSAVITMANTGLRVSELCHLTLADVDLTNKVLKVRQGKGNKDRSIPINEKLHQELTTYLKDHRPLVSSDRFFATSKTGTLSRQTINHELENTTRKLGWDKHVTAHILRHSFASSLVRNNAPLPAVQKLMGHSDLRVTSRYIHQNMDQLHQAVNLI